jgi:ketosteroid isomerase-like protein
MRRTLCALSLLLALSAAAPAQEAGPEPKTKEAREVFAVLREWLGALARNDLPAVERIVADDYRITASAEGVVLDKTQDLAPLKSGEIKFETAEASDVDVRVFGDTAVVTGVARFRVNSGGRALNFAERFTDVYVKRKGRWQPVASHTTPLRQPKPAGVEQKGAGDNVKQAGADGAGPRVLVESVEVEGNRRLTDAEIRSHIRSRHGEVYDSRQVMRDLQELLELGVFDTRQTRVQMTAGVRGGVVVIFFVAELPVIADLKFEGLPKGLTESDVLKALGAEGIKVSKGDVYDPARMSRAKDVVRRLLDERGRASVTVELSLEDVSATTVSVKFVVSERRDF